MAATILFDGMCNLCSSSVQFIIKNDPAAHFSFASLQSEKGKELIKQYDIPQHIESVVLVEKNNYFVKSDAALRISKNLTGLYKYLSMFRIVPRPLRDRIYGYVAKNRYKWFGKKDACMIPTPELRERFIDQ